MELKKYLPLVAAFVCGGAAVYMVPPILMARKKMETVCICNLRKGLRKLWADHVIWTREYIVAAVAGTPDAQAAAARLLKNQEDLGAAIVPFYGKEAGDQLTKLLKEHILVAVDVVAAAKAGDNKKLEAADKKWHQNADEIAHFLAAANPHWPEKEMQAMMYEHLKLTTAEAVNRLQKKWDADVKNFDVVFEQIMHMADDIAEGIAQQFPHQVK